MGLARRPIQEFRKIIGHVEYAVEHLPRTVQSVVELDSTNGEKYTAGSIAFVDYITGAAN